MLRLCTYASPLEAGKIHHGVGHEARDEEQPVEKKEHPEVLQPPDVLRKHTEVRAGGMSKRGHRERCRPRWCRVTKRHQRRLAVRIVVRTSVSADPHET